MLYLSSGDFFQNLFFENYLPEIPPEYETVLTLIRPDDSLDLIWVQTVCQGYQQTTLVDKKLKYVSCLNVKQCVCQLCAFNLRK